MRDIETEAERNRQINIQREKEMKTDKYTEREKQRQTNIQRKSGGGQT